MKTTLIVTVLGTTVLLCGCASTSKVQEMIDANQQDYTNRLDAHEASIDVLKKTSMASLEKAKANAALLDEIQAELVKMNQQMKVNKGFAEASKVMSAANTVKVAELDEHLTQNTQADEEARERLMEIDRLYEGVMITHYEKIVESASEAIELLKSEGWTGSTNAPVAIDEPIEIIAPTAVPSSNAPGDEPLD
ncbi:hypothetical protein [Pontiella agarivorans]|uniref:Uncharacterized protein n=1 Tax=Pontiella agarivorans TaxID=3038953 RepID=A0ABU5MVQ9_9BACT|nr:hypothetical protein [Pontiella agarivorans]MDZ8118031.1 hypothetical protein [Pontiella agarivorans]